MKPERVEEPRVESTHGTDLAYHVVGDGLPILLANGLGGSWKAWTHQIAFFQDRVRPEWSPRRVGFARTFAVRTAATRTSKISSTACAICVL